MASMGTTSNGSGAAGDAPPLHFEIVSASTYESSHPPSELLNQSLTTKGWQSMRFCDFPQELILRFDGLVKISAFQVLSHETKISSKIALFVARPSEEDVRANRFPDISTVSFHALGHMSLADNAGSNYRTRELKLVYLDTTACYLKLSLHKNHVNSYNLYNQVGLIAVNPLGVVLQRLTSEPSVSMKRAISSDSVSPLSSGPPVFPLRDSQDVSIDIEYDGRTAARIRELEEKKLAAVEAESYDEAKRYKIAIQKLKTIGRHIAKLERDKARAVADEDYDLAKSLKSEIDRLRLESEHPEESDYPVAAVNSSNRPSFNKHDRDDMFAPRRGSAVDTERNMEGFVENLSISSSQLHGSPSYDASSTRSQPFPSSISSSGIGQFDHSRSPLSSRPPPLSMGTDHSLEYDDKPIPTAATAVDMPAWYEKSENVRDPSDAAPRSVPEPRKKPTRPVATSSINDSDSPFAPNSGRKDGGSARPSGGSGKFGSGASSGWEKQFVERVLVEASSEVFEPTEDSFKSDSDGVEISNTLGVFVARCTCDSSWQLREASIKALTSLIPSAPFEPPVRVAGAGALIRRGLKDKLAQIPIALYDLIRVVGDEIANQAPEHEFWRSIEPAFPLLFERAADNNPRLRSGAHETMIYLAGHPLVPSRALGPTAMKIPSKANWRRICAHVQFLQEYLYMHGVDTDACSLTVDDIIPLVLEGLNHANKEVRTVSVDLAGSLYYFIGTPVNKYFKDVKPATFKLLEETFKAIDEEDANQQLEAETSG